MRRWHSACPANLLVYRIRQSSLNVRDIRSGNSEFKYSISG